MVGWLLSSAFRAVAQAPTSLHWLPTPRYPPIDYAAPERAPNLGSILR